MQRIHIHIGVNDLAESIRFYSSLLGRTPTVEKPDYAKWLLDDPAVNLAITPAKDRTAGVNHIGIQTGTGDELTSLHTRLSDAGFSDQAEPNARCCYAESDKYWTHDPSGVTWELFHTHRLSDSFGENRTIPDVTQSDCCHTARAT